MPRFRNSAFAKHVIGFVLGFGLLLIGLFLVVGDLDAGGNPSTALHSSEIRVGTAPVSHAVSALATNSATSPNTPTVLPTTLSGTSTPQRTAVPPTPTTTGTATQQPPTDSPSGFLNLPFPRGNPPTFDPPMADDTASEEIIMEVFSGLTTIAPDLTIQPDLAESWSISEDQRIYTFKLRPDAKFQNGTPITAHDFKYSLERAADPQLNSPDTANLLGDIEGVLDKLEGRRNEVSGVQVMDAHTLQITLVAPRAYLLARLAQPVAFVVDRENVETGGANWFLKPNGSGPYKLLSYTPNDRIELESNANYVGEPRPKIRKVTYWIQTTPSFGAEYVNGKVDVALLNAVEVQYVFDPASPLHDQVTVAPYYRLEYIGLNTKVAPFDDPKVRQAFALAIDKQQIADDYLRHTAFAARGFYPPGFPGFNVDLKVADYDPLRARQLLSESRYGSADKLPRLRLNLAQQTLVSQAVIQMLRQNLGVDIEVVEHDVPTFLDSLLEKPMPYQMYELGRVLTIPDPVVLDGPFYSKSIDNSTSYNNPEVDRLLLATRGEPDAAARLKLYQEAERLIINDAPWIPLVWGDNYWLVQPYVKGLVFPPFNLPRLKYAWLDNPPSVRGVLRKPTPNPNNPPVQTTDGGVVVPIDLATNDIVFNPKDNLIYASVPGDAREHANTITALDARTGVIRASYPIGSEPNKLALADDGKTLWVALDGAAAIKRFDLTTQTASEAFSLGEDPFDGPYYVEEMEVMPGSPDTVAISRRVPNLTPRHKGVAIYDQGVMRPHATQDHTGSNTITFGDAPDVMYGYNNETTEYGLRRLEITAGGVFEQEVKKSLFESHRGTIHFSNGFLYASSGAVVDAKKFTLVGTYPAQGLVLPDAERKQTFILTDSNTLRVFDPETFVLKTAYAIPDALGTASDLIGVPGGLAFRTDAGQVFIIKLPEQTAQN